MLSKSYFSVSFVIISLYINLFIEVEGIGVNWGSQASHPLPPATVVRLLRVNGIQKVKLFEADSEILRALSRSGIQVMVGIPNDLLAPPPPQPEALQLQRYGSLRMSLLMSPSMASISVGNEPFLKSFNGTFEGITLIVITLIATVLVDPSVGSCKFKIMIKTDSSAGESSAKMPLIRSVSVLLLLWMLVAQNYFKFVTLIWVYKAN
ncbi:hypothetical protein YC2023_095624 [Brassica napus]